MGIFSVIGAGIGSLFGPPGTAIGGAIGGALDAGISGKKQRRKARRFDRAAERKRQELLKYNDRYKRRQVAALEVGEQKLERLLEDRFNEMYFKLSDSKQDIDALIEDNYEELIELAQGAYAEKQLAIDEGRLRSMQVAQDDESVKKALEMQAKFDATYGPIEQQLGDFYNNLDDTELSRYRISNLKSNLNEVKQSVNKSLALRGLANSGLLIKTMANLEYKAAIEAEEIKMKTKYEVADKKQDFLKLGLTQGTAQKTISALQKQQQNFMSIEKDYSNKVLDNLGLKQDREMSAQVGKSAELLQSEKNFSAAELDLIDSKTKGDFVLKRDFLDRRYDLNQEVASIRRGIRAGDLAATEARAREARARADKQDDMFGEALGKLITVGIDQYNKSKEGE